MKKAFVYSTVICFFISSFTFADTFGAGANQFEIEFVTISGDNGDLGSWSAGDGYTFSGVNHGDYRMGTYEITNDQWTKFKNEYGTVIGSPSYAYDSDPYFTGTNVPTNCASWYEVAQFVNWLNTSSGHQAAYKFSGTQGTSDYTLEVWQSGDTGYDASNPFRNSNAYYFLPTEDEWVKAAYWNGMNLQTWATVGDVAPTLAGWNFYDGRYATYPYGPWDVGDGAQELNGTYDMMGNVLEWMESPYYSGNYLSGSVRGIRGGCYNSGDDYAGVNSLSSSYRIDADTLHEESNIVGFRVASIPEPTTVLLVGIGAVMMKRRK